MNHTIRDKNSSKKQKGTKYQHLTAEVKLRTYRFLFW